MGRMLRQRLDYHMEPPCRRSGSLRIIGKLAASDPPPWTIFANPPCRTAGAFFRLCGGMTQDQTAAVLAACGHTDLADVVRDL